MTAATLSDECRAVAAVLRAAARNVQGEHRAGPRPAPDLDDVDAVGLLVAHEHGLAPERVVAYRSLARSRGLTLEQVLRAQMRGELADVVRLPPVERVGHRGPAA